MTGPSDTRAEPGEAEAEQGAVLLDGLDGAVVTMTPGAAKETGHRLVEAAARAEQDNDPPEESPSSGEECDG